MVLPRQLITFDTESSGLGSGAYPVSIGVSGPLGRLWHWMIKPSENWTYWDEISEEIHGFSRDDLEKGGWSPFLLARELNRTFHGHHLIADALHDIDMMNELFNEVGIDMSFKCLTIHEVIGAKQARKVLDFLESEEWPHRADEDAIILRNALVLKAKA